MLLHSRLHVYVIKLFLTVTAVWLYNIYFIVTHTKFADKRLGNGKENGFSTEVTALIAPHCAHNMESSVNQSSTFIQSCLNVVCLLGFLFN